MLGTSRYILIFIIVFFISIMLLGVKTLILLVPIPVLVLYKNILRLRFFFKKLNKGFGLFQFVQDFK